MLIDDENDLRAGLRALTAATPAQPAERVDRAVGRARRIRQRRAALATAAVVLPAAVIGLRLTAAPPAADDATVLGWPVHRDPELAAYEENAWGEWRFHHEVPSGEGVRFLWSARLPGAGERTIGVAFATCSADACSRAVLLTATESHAAEPPADDGANFWLGDAREIDQRVGLTPLSTYAVSDGGGNTLLVLAGPDAQRVAWSSPSKRPGTGGAGEVAPLGGGAFVQDVGYLSAHTTITVYDATGAVRHEGRAGGPTEVPLAPMVVDVEVPPTHQEVSAFAGQASAPFTSVEGAAKPGRYAVFARCLGTAPLRVVVGSATGQVVCDGTTRLAIAEVPLPDGAGYEVEVTSEDPFTSFAVAMAEPV